ncbi:MAG: hypothetical protein C0P74_011300 [Gammaproteobacteria bacterium]|nr:hypothetical protein [Gammaproteobacteria bacterium]
MTDSLISRRTVLAATGAAALTVGAPLRVSAADAKRKPTARGGARPPTLRNTHGKILYINDDGTERGREWFSVTWRRDGQITLRAYCEIDDGEVERDVVQTMTSSFAPIDCFVRLHVRGKFLGSGMMRFSDTEAECDVYNVEVGRLRQVIKLDRPVPTLVTHPLSTDALLAAQFDHSKSERVQYWEGGMTSSPLLDGASGPLLSPNGRRAIEYVGRERITVPAGTFDTHHYRLLLSPRPDGTKTTYEFWATHPDYVFVRGAVSGYLKNKTGSGTYELVEYEG